MGELLPGTWSTHSGLAVVPGGTSVGQGAVGEQARGERARKLAHERLRPDADRRCVAR